MLTPSPSLSVCPVYRRVSSVPQKHSSLRPTDNPQVQYFALVKQWVPSHRTERCQATARSWLHCVDTNWEVGGEEADRTDECGQGGNPVQGLSFCVRDVYWTVRRRFLDIFARFYPF